MSTLLGLQDSGGWEQPLSKPLDEAVWQAWLEKNRARDQRSSAARVEGVKWVSIVGLLAAAGLWSHLTLYEVVARFIVAAGAIVVMFQAFHARHYASAVVFGVFAVLYNPVAPAFSFSTDWQRVLVLASALPFIASLGWRYAKQAHYD